MMTMNATRSRQVSVVVVLIAALMLLGSAQAQPQPSDEAIWQQFLEWLPSAPPVDGVRILLDQYRSRLISNGAPTTEADRQLGIIQRAMQVRSDGWRIMFNNIYSNSTPGFVTQPNALLVATVEGRKPGRALDIGIGQGRNAVFLALKGWDVTGFDLSDEGIAVARKNAERAGVKLNAILTTDEAFDYGSHQWDLIAFIYEPFPVTSAAYVERLRKSMKSGGIIVIESYADEATAPDRQAVAIDPGQLLAAFKDFRLLHFEDIVTMPDWNIRAKRRIVRMVAEKRP
ncbi:MAG TPA: methyltransferase domain-containing protein [Syntrophorhabdales bacterium]|nr:methyltransferase domain-containing protein [Syntrophorhabdales bacterium]